MSLIDIRHFAIDVRELQSGYLSGFVPQMRTQLPEGMFHSDNLRCPLTVGVTLIAGLLYQT